MSHSRITLGIVGFGRFGRLAAHHLKDHFDIKAFDPGPASAREGVEMVSLADCCQAERILVAVPISGFEAVISEIAPLVRPGSLVLDVCSVKEHPMRVMARHLAGKCEFMGTHPLFGPDTAAQSLTGRSIVLCPSQDKALAQKASAFFRGLGLEVFTVTAEEHDRDMARSLALIHLLGRALLSVGADQVKISTKTHERLLELVAITNHDSRQLFLDMHRFNRHTARARKVLLEELTKLDQELSARA